MESASAIYGKEIEISEPSKESVTNMKRTYSIIRNFALMFMSEISRIDIECSLDKTLIFDPESSTIEVDKQPFVRIDRERSHLFDAL